MAVPVNPDNHASSDHTHNNPSKLVRFTLPRRALMLLLLQPSNEATDNPSKLAYYPFKDGG